MVVVCVSVVLLGWYIDARVTSDVPRHTLNEDEEFARRYLNQLSARETDFGFDPN